MFVNSKTDRQTAITVIIPVYNVEKVLGKCIRSIQRQTFTNWKMVLVDDGSTDSSGRMCDEYAQSDSRICALHTTNGGPHAARMKGLEQISDDGYICFCDSDDEMPFNALQILYDEAVETGADLVCGNVERIYKGIRISKGSTLSCFAAPRAYTSDEVRSDLYLSCFGGGRFPVSLWGKLYKTALIRPIMLNLDEHPKWFAEDLNVIMRVLPNVKKLAVVGDVVYRYRVGGGTSRFMPTFLDDNILMYRLKMQWSDQCTAKENVKRLIGVELKNVIVSYWIMCEKSHKYPHGNLSAEVKAVCALPEAAEALTMLEGDCSGLPGIDQPLVDRDYKAVCELIRNKVKNDRPKDILKKLLMGRAAPKELL